MEGIKYEKQATPQSIFEEIRRKYSTSREFMQAVVDASKGQRAHSGKADVGGVIARLASIRTEAFGREGEQLSPNDEPISPDAAKQIWSKAVNFSFLVAAVYHGEATFVDEDGSLLGAPSNIKS